MTQPAPAFILRRHGQQTPARLHRPAITMVLNTGISWGKDWKEGYPLPDVACMIAALYGQPKSMVVTAARDQLRTNADTRAIMRRIRPFTGT